ncbi:hypothetical protein ACFQMN_13860 [Halobacillus campisalis]|uniref:Uncharacterized protein n=2 Tax=Halobacillus campisalis TaxID=435909 RepID=A0ABW2K734_9BACI|nr:hypothetical protein [Halobacillus campisalis]
MTDILRYKIMSTEKIADDRRIHVFDMLNQRNLSFNYESIKRSPQRKGGEEELSEFLDTKKYKIDHGYYDKKGRVS